MHSACIDILCRAILRDEKRYPRADQFIPERFLTKDGTQIDPSVPDPVEAFGYGRRICPGRHLADTAVFLAIAYSLWAFDISCPLDQYGRPIKPTGEYTSGLLTSVPLEVSPIYKLLIFIHLQVP